MSKHEERKKRWGKPVFCPDCGEERIISPSNYCRARVGADLTEAGVVICRCQRHAIKKQNRHLSRLIRG